MSFDILPRLRTRDQSSSIISRFGGFQVFAWPMSPVSYALAFAFNSLYFLLIWIPKRFKVRLGSQVRLHAELHTLCLSRLSARLATLQVQSRNFRLLKLEKLHIAELTSEYNYRSPRAQELSWHTQEPTRTWNAFEPCELQSFTDYSVFCGLSPHCRNLRPSFQPDYQTVRLRSQRLVISLGSVFLRYFYTF